MPFNINTLTSYFTKAVEQFQTTLALSATYNAPIITLTTLVGSNSSYVNGDVAAFALDAGNTKQNVVIGTINTTNSTLTGCIWTEGGNNNHLAGAIVADVTSATDWNALVSGLLKQHKQSGAHSAVTADSLAVAGTLSGGASTLASLVLNGALTGTGLGAQIQSQANTGAGTGTFSYINLGGIKLLWGSLTVTSATAGGALNFIVNFPNGFFTTAPIPLGMTVFNPISTGNWSQYITTSTTSSASITAINQSTGTGSVGPSYAFIGT